MPVLDELGIYLDGQGVIERDGASRNWYEGTMPDETPDPALALFLSGSWQPPEHALGQETTRLEFPTLQLMARGSVLSTTLTLIRAAYNAFVKIGARASVGQSEVLTGVRYLAVEARQQPYILDRDANLRWRMICNFYATKDPS